MGCNKSKPQHGRADAHINGQHGQEPNPWELVQEPQSFFGEFNQNGNSNVGSHSDRAFNYQLSVSQPPQNSEHQTGYGYSNVSITGYFGEAAPTQRYDPSSEFNNMQYFSANEYGVNSYNHRSFNSLSELTNPDYNNFNHNSCIQRQYHNQRFVEEHEPIMGPPSRPIARPGKGNMPRLLRPLTRCRSFNNDNRRRDSHNNYRNNLVRHSSLENIPTTSGFRNRYSRNKFASDNNLFHNSSDSNEDYPRGSIPRWRNSERRGLRRGLKRNSWEYDDSLHNSSTSSDYSRFSTENNNMPDLGPRVKRKPSDEEDPHIIAIDEPTSDKNVEKEKTACNEETKVVHQSVEQLTASDEPFDILDLLMFPQEWSSCAVDRTGLVDISLTSPEGKSVQKYFSRTSQSKDFKLSITAIARIENPFMHSYYLLKKREMESRNEHVDELYLYHGTKKEHLSGILEDNLNWRLYSEKHRFGQGVSFSPLATYSSHYSDKGSEKVMLLFKVLTSNSINGSPDMKVPPIVDDVVYDVSIKDDTTVIVKYSDNEFYPLYKITYLKITRN